MEKRYLSLWFRQLRTDWFSRLQPTLKSIPFVLRTASHGRMIVSASNQVAQKKGIHIGMLLADAKAAIPELSVMEDKPGLEKQLLQRLAEWCIRFTPVVAVDLPDGLIMDASGCAHLWGNEENYIKEITNKLTSRGYDVSISMASTVGLAWGMARLGANVIVSKDHHLEALGMLPPEGLRIEPSLSDRLHKLGLHQVKQFMHIPRASLRKRFGNSLLQQLDKALGAQMEMLEPIIPMEPYHERLPTMEPIVTATGIGLALKELLKILCTRFYKEQVGARKVVFKCYRIDGNVIQVEIGTSKPNFHAEHLFKLFENKLSMIEPDLGIELFVLEAPIVESIETEQEKLWSQKSTWDNVRLAELLDRIANRAGEASIKRYEAAQHYWPERSYQRAPLTAKLSSTEWPSEKPRPLQLLPCPERIEVTAPIPDYPPMLFRYQGKLHKIMKADGPERIENEWWIEQSLHRDYYQVEDEEGARYWLFRLGHYHDKIYQWFIHGFFA